MKINSAIPSVGGVSDSGATRTPASVKKTATAETGERIDISSLSARLQEVGAGEAPVDARRIAEIKQAIAEGRFLINPERIADGLIESVRDMLGRSGKAA